MSSFVPGEEIECFVNQVILHKLPVFDNNGNQIFNNEGRPEFKSGFKIAGGIDQDNTKSPQGYPDKGIYVTYVHEGGPAEMAGLKVHDKILQVNGHDMTMVTHKKAVDYITRKSVLEMFVHRLPENVENTSETFRRDLPQQPQQQQLLQQQPQLQQQQQHQQSMNTNSNFIKNQRDNDNFPANFSKMNIKENVDLKNQNQNFNLQRYVQQQEQQRTHNQQHQHQQQQPYLHHQQQQQSSHNHQQQQQQQHQQAFVNSTSQPSIKTQNTLNNNNYNNIPTQQLPLKLSSNVKNMADNQRNYESQNEQRINNNYRKPQFPFDPNNNIPNYQHHQQQQPKIGVNVVNHQQYGARYDLGANQMPPDNNRQNSNFPPTQTQYNSNNHQARYLNNQNYISSATANQQTNNNNNNISPSRNKYN